jgi:hypothetical protein
MPAMGASVVGGILSLRVPRNPLGLVFLCLGVTLSVGLAADAYAGPAVHLPGYVAVAVAANLLEELLWVWLPVMLLLFPGGELPSPRWRPVGIVVGVSAAAVAVTILGSPGTIGGFSNTLQIENPLRVSGIIGLVIGVAGGIGFITLVLVTVVMVGSLTARFRRARGDERQQLKWFAAAAAFLAAAVVSGPLGLWSVWSGNVWVFLWALATTTLVLAMGIAILRYRLYGIDVIIRKTLVYATVVGSLAVVYLGGIYLIGNLLQTLTGQSGPLAVTLSTLTIAAMFDPLRTRVQRAVDHRFYRGKYDAARTLERFSGRLRDQIELDALSADLLGVVNLTLQPIQASLWLRRNDPHSPDPAWESTVVHPHRLTPPRPE